MSDATPPPVLPITAVLSVDPSGLRPYWGHVNLTANDVHDFRTVMKASVLGRSEPTAQTGPVLVVSPMDDGWAENLPDHVVDAIHGTRRLGGTRLIGGWKRQRREDDEEWDQAEIHTSYVLWKKGETPDSRTAGPLARPFLAMAGVWYGINEDAATAALEDLIEYWPLQAVDILGRGISIQGAGRRTPFQQLPEEVLARLVGHPNAMVREEAKRLVRRLGR